MRLLLEIKNDENIIGIGDYEKRQIEEIVTALIQTGGMTGVKGGQTIIHFDALGVFQGVQLDYWPYRRRNNRT